MNKVVHKTPEEYGPKFNDHLLEQYKVIRSRIVNIIDDRNTQNKFLLTVLGALFVIPSFILQQHDWSEPLPFPVALLLIPFPLVGVLISWHWAKWNETFGQAIAAGYKILNEMEAHLPAQPFSMESQYRKEMGGGRHKTTTSFTILMADIFTTGNLILSAAALYLLWQSWR